MTLDACDQTVSPGLCQGNFTRWYYDKSSQTCSTFNYGGCKGNKNNFLTKESCSHKCINPLKTQGKCEIILLLSRRNSFFYTQFIYSNVKCIQKWHEFSR